MTPDHPTLAGNAGSVADICQSCGKRPATMNWVGDGGTMAFIHGMYQRWCDHCALRAQIAHAQKMADLLPELQAKLAALEVVHD